MPITASATPRLARPAAAAARLWRHCRLVMLCAGLAALSACASQHVVDNRIEAQHYAELAPGHYKAPGTAEDPWGPYINEAAQKYDVPATWIRGVMHQESGGMQFASDGTLTISDKGAMGLMQVMPETYDELRGRYGLGGDPYDPHSNIMAGTAYMRELYDLYGSPGFLAAYNCGPGRLDKYLAGTATLPDQTRRYVAMIGPNIQGVWPVVRSGAEQLALNQLPLNIPAGLRYARSYAVASRRHGRGEVQVASRNRAGRAYAANTRTGHGRSGAAIGDGARVQLAMATPRSAHGFHLISAAQADMLPVRRSLGGAGGWAVQVGAYGNQAQAHAAAEAARGGTSGRSAVGAVRQGKATLYRARLTGMSRDAAITACGKMHRGSCMVIAPNSQS